MAYDYKSELAAVKKYYEGDPLQKRFSALICGSIGSGKTFLLRTARKPIHIDSFDPGGTKGLRDLIEAGDVVADTSYEAEDPFNPTAWERWVKRTELRFQIGYFNHFGTYALDSSTKWQDAAMNFQLKGAGRIGGTPQHRHDYNPVKITMQNYITKFMNLPCDFIFNGHFREDEEIIAVDTKTGIERKNVEYRFLTIGQASVTIPLMFDEIYVLQTSPSSEGLKRTLLLESQGKYLARSRLRANGKLDTVEPANIKHLLKKIGMPYEDKPKLSFDLVEKETR
jgi:hypothetical protein